MGLSLRLMEKAANKKDKTREAYILCIGQYELQIDRNGKIKLPEHCLKKEGFHRGSTLILVGVGDRYEIYPKAEWERIRADLEELEDIAKCIEIIEF